MSRQKWAPIDSFGGIYKGLYEVSNHGKVRSRLVTEGRPGYKQRYPVKIRNLKIYSPNNSPLVKMEDKFGNKNKRLVRILVADAWLRPRTMGGPVEYIKRPKNKNQPLDNSVNNLKEPGQKKIIGRNQKLSPADVRDIIEILKEKGDQRGIISETAKRYGVKQSTISKLATGVNWKDLTYVDA